MRLRAAAILAAGLLAAFGAGCGGGEDEAAAPDTVEGTTATQPEETETAIQTDEETGAEGDAEAGADVFSEAGCGGCHALEAAGSSGTIGPNLNDAKPAFELVVERVTNGKGAMPSFKDQLSEEDIRNVAAYVVQSTG